MLDVPVTCHYSAHCTHPTFCFSLSSCVFSCLNSISHQSVHAAEGLHSHIKITTECPLLSTVWVPFIQTKPDVISFCPLKVVNQRPVEHASHIIAFLDGFLNLQSAQETPKFIYCAHIRICTP